MTVVLRYEQFGNIVFLGDLLISGPKFSDCEPQLPTTENAWQNLKGIEPVVPLELRQKLVVVAKNLVIGWSGPLDKAEDLFSCLVAESGKRTFDRHSLDKRLMELDERFELNKFARHEDEALHLIATILDDEGHRTFSCAAPFNTVQFDNACLIGSGAVPVEQLLLNSPSAEPAGHGTPSPQNVVLGNAMGIAGMLLNYEVVTLNNLKELYGGGYEIVLRTTEGFQKLDNIVYIFWTATATSDEVDFHKTPYRVCRFAYQDDLLQVHVAAVSPEMRVSTKLLLIAPPHRRVTPDEIKLAPPSLNARFMCNLITVMKDGKLFGVNAFVMSKTSADSREYVHFSESFDMVSVEQRFYEMAAEQIQRYVNR